MAGSDKPFWHETPHASIAGSMTHMYFREYASIDNSKHCGGQAIPADADWVVTEKVHGTNTGIYVDANGSVKVARRTGFADLPEKHYRADVVVEKLSASFRCAALEVLAKHGCGAPTDFVIFYGELYGAVYPGLECKAGLLPVQRGVYYSNDVHFICFDIVVVRPSEKRETGDADAVVKLWREARKNLVLFDKNRESVEARSNLETHCAKIDEEVSAGLAKMAPTADYIRDVLAGRSGHVIRDMPPCPNVVLSPHETMLSQTDRCETCARHGVPFSRILFKGTKHAAMEFSKATRTAPTAIAKQHGMLEPYTEREGNVVRTDMPIHVGERATLVVMKDKNPKFNEVAHSKHVKHSDDLKMEAPRFITRNRLDNVVSKVEIGTTAKMLAELLSEDALSDMMKKEQFAQVFAEQSEVDATAVKTILDAHSIKLVAGYKSDRQESLDVCILCEGSGILLRGFCPLCEGEGGF
eukprot:TRINITY_DN92809_c0_g1_i1.p1 TRINITY_DN92809_c0_g1~~TRINITY_DN92809_c0_g1_i1.p1  ORF type:complete len:491 (-),score=49.59 TRINITY_DN92809_c0_g1_i1:175-1581(-)